MPKTDWGQKSITQWPQAAWPTQTTKKLASTGPEVYPVSRTEWGQRVVAQWPQPEWPTQTTRKLTRTGPELFPMPRTDPGHSRIVGLWPQWDWATQTTRKVATSGPIKTPFSHQAYLALDQWPQPEWSTQVTRKKTRTGPPVVVIPPVEPPGPIPDVVRTNYTGRYLVTANRLQPYLHGSVWKKTRKDVY
jgi:hypothetical protein